MLLALDIIIIARAPKLYTYMQVFYEVPSGKNMTSYKICWL